MTTPTRTPIPRLLGIAILTSTLLLTGCTNTDPDPTTTTNTTTDTTTPTEPETTPTEPQLTDHSDAVLGFTFPTEPIAETTGAVNLERDPATLTIYALEASQTTTRLIFQISSTDGRRLDSLSIATWSSMPMLDDTAGGKRYYVNTVTHRLVNTENVQLGVYLPPNGHLRGYAPLTAQYPPLPADVSAVQISMVGFDPVTVPVTRS